MVRLVISLSLLLSSACFAEDIPSFSAPGKYQAAVAKAQQAFIVQIGIQAKIDTAKDYANKTAIYLAKWTTLDKEIGTVLWCVRVYNERKVSFRLSNTRAMTLSQNYVQLVLNF